MLSWSEGTLIIGRVSNWDPGSLVTGTPLAEVANLITLVQQVKLGMTQGISVAQIYCIFGF